MLLKKVSSVFALLTRIKCFSSNSAYLPLIERDFSSTSASTPSPSLYLKYRRVEAPVNDDNKND